MKNEKTLSILIDESGDLGSDSNYFIMAAIIVDDKLKLDRIINKVRRTNKKELGKFNELKGTEAKPHIKKKVLEKLNKVDYQAIIIVFDKKNKYKIDYKPVDKTELQKELKLKKDNYRSLVGE